ncbi:glycoside hydrolase family 3 N-terminal domain-containing protein [Flavobacterium sp.]|uniref:glycoside hydrolase family 3 N-terminal domain-containing protein n=1 Tax=Flavobacterium sp. TaxID=239 RepID=UPI002625A444|nr:glycoside hydrolase family 3 N-terminal domain-containing protein [Flavobacterium sp.]MDD3004075.1 glycoside hydrolase family 3 N-terminal domain-containing protein [Flavobacterium sp.]
MNKFLLLLIFLGQYAFAQNKFADHKTPAQIKWVDSLYNQMSLEEKIGQLFMVAAYSNKDTVHNNSIEKLVSNYKIGGLIFFQGGPKRQANLTNRYQKKAKIPLFIGIDAEWGLAMRLDSVARFPWNMTLGAVKDLKLIEEVGKSYALQSKRMGIHFNFAPVLDINTDPKNPIIGNRSFGENKENITKSALALMQGIQNNGVFATGKHFPGHGATSTDSHYTLPTIDFSKEHIEDVELYPYKKLFEEGLASVMVAHLNVPSMETRENFPSSLSYNIVTEVLQKQLGFDGLIFTDALNMKGASNYKKPGEIDLAAFLAGNDVLLFAENVPLALEKICVAYQDSIISEERLQHSVKKILNFKYKIGLNKYKSIDTLNLIQDLNPATDKALQYKLYENAITVVKNRDQILPIKNYEKEKIAYVKLGDDAHTSFLSSLQNYTEVTEIKEDNIDSLMVKLQPFTKVIVGFHKADGAWRNHDFKAAERTKLDSIAKYKHIILDVFAKPYSLLPFDDFENYDGLVISYQNNEVSQIVSSEIIFGAVGSKGKLPVSINDFFPVNHGLETHSLNVLGFSAPENVNMNSAKLAQIDTIVQQAIKAKMTPGAQVLVAKDGKIIYQKAFGSHTYDNKVKVKNTDLYDTASLTKIIATLPNVMHLYDTQKVHLQTKLGTMLPDFNDSNKRNTTFTELLSHHAQLKAWEPFYKATLDSLGKPNSQYYKKKYDAQFSKQVADSLFIQKDYHDTVIDYIKKSELLPKKEYKYSDFTFILLKEFLEKTERQSLDVLAFNHFFQPLGMTSTTYNPLNKFPQSSIVPTEIDTYFRHQKLQGFVHDMEAAMEGGVAGHAGIFSNSLDLAKMMQMYLQKGNYGGKKYFSSATFDAFNTRYFESEGNRRGLGFDKPQLPGTAGPTCGCASASSFGHTGFTGTMAWADPEHNLVYIFLSNRTYPDSNAPNQLSKANIREDIQKVIYDAIIK